MTTLEVPDLMTSRGYLMTAGSNEFGPNHLIISAYLLVCVEGPDPLEVHVKEGDCFPRAQARQGIAQPASVP